MFYIKYIAILSLLIQISCNNATFSNREDWLVENDKQNNHKTDDYCQNHPDSQACKIIGVSHVSTLFEQVKSSRKVDIIWVIDNSGSMQDEQENLANTFSKFISEFTKTSADFRIGITTTDTNCTEIMRHGTPKSKGACGEFVVNPENPLPFKPILDSSMDPEEIKQQFAYNVKVGINGSFDEAGLKAAKLAIDLSNDPKSNNYGFIRDDAFLVVIFVSDENDASSTPMILPDDPKDVVFNPVEDYVSYYASFKKNGNLDLFLYSIVDTITVTPEYNHLLAHYYGGHRYITASELSGGFTEEITKDFSAALQVIGEDIVNKTNKYVLHGVPNHGSIKIFLNGDEVPNDINDGWFYDDEEKVIFFNGSYSPKKEDIIEISYSKYIYSL